jgi:hypothetical protein
VSAEVQLTLQSDPVNPAQLTAWDALWSKLLSEEIPKKGNELEGATPSSLSVLSRPATASDVPDQENDPHGN